MLDRLAQGKKGEQLATDFLQAKGYRILARNFRTKFGEIDIVATFGNYLVFVEVKTRSSRKFGLPEEAVQSNKIRHLVKSGYYFKKLHPQTPNLLRVDLVAIELLSNGQVKNIKLIENIT